MTLNRRYIRNIKHNLSFYICVTILTALVIVMYIGFTGAYDGEGRYLDSFYEDTNVEEAQFVTANPIYDKSINNLEEKYNVQLEKQTYADIDLTEENCDDRTGKDIAEDYTLRIFTPSKKIDTYKLLDGEDVTSDDEILLNPHLMDARGLQIGDFLDIDGRNYKIVGTMARPDYLAVYKNLSDNMFLFDTFGYAVVSESAFAQINDDTKTSYYTVIYDDKDQEKAFREEIHSEYYTLSYIPASTNVRIKVPQNEREQLKLYMNMIIPMLVVFVMVIIAIVLGRKIKSEARQIGVLSALGYGRTRLSLHYGLFGVIPGVIGAVIGAIAAAPCRDALATAIFEMKTEILPVDYSSETVQFVIICIVPIVAYGIVGLLTALRVLRFKTIDLLQGNGGTRKRRRLRMAKSNMKFTTKFKIRSILGNWSRSLVVIFGIAVGGILMVFCYVCIDSLDNYCDVSVNEVGDYEYEYFLSSIQTEKVDGAAEIMTGTFSVDGYTTNLTYMGMDNNEFMDLKSTSGDKLELTSGKTYISAMGAMIYGVGKGDELTFYDQASLSEYTVTIDDVVQNDSQSILYSSWNDACDLLDVPEGSYNAVMSDKELDYKESDYLYRITKSDLSDQIGQITVQMKSVLSVCIGFAVLIIVICVYLMVNMLISENASSISMLKVLGYDDRQISRMMISIYHILVPIGIVIGSVLGVVLCRVNFEASVSAYNTYIETVYTPLCFVKYFVCVLISYVISLWLLSRKVKKADMVESLKDNRE